MNNNFEEYVKEQKIKKLEKKIYRLEKELLMKELEYKDLVKRYTKQNNELCVLKAKLYGGSNDNIRSE